MHEVRGRVTDAVGEGVMARGVVDGRAEQVIGNGQDASAPTGASAPPTETPPALLATRQALLATLHDPASMAAVKRAAASFAGRRGTDAADELLAAVVAATWSGDTARDPEAPIQKHLIMAMEFRALELHRYDRRHVPLEAMPEDKEADSAGTADEEAAALAVRLERLERVLPRLRARLRDDPDALATLVLFEAGLGRAQAKSKWPGCDVSRTQLHRNYHNARRRLTRAARAIAAELVSESELANDDVATVSDAGPAPAPALTSITAIRHADRRTFSATPDATASTRAAKVRTRRAKRST